MDSKKAIILYAGIGGGLYFLYRYLSQNCPGQTTGMCSIYNSIFGASTAAPPASTGGGGAPPPPSGIPPPITTTPPPTTTAPPVTTAPPPAPTVTIVGKVSPNINNSLSADISVNGSPRMNISIIQDSGRAYDSTGTDVTDHLTALGISVPALLQQFQTAYASSQTSSTGCTTLTQTIATYKAQIAATTDPNQLAALNTNLAALQSAAKACGLSGINDYPDLDLAYPYVFGKSSLGAMADDRFAHSRIPVGLVHRGPRLIFRRG